MVERVKTLYRYLPLLVELNKIKELKEDHQGLGSLESCPMAPRGGG